MNDTDSVPAGLTWPKYWARCSKEYATTHKPELESAKIAAAAKLGTNSPIAINEDDPTNSSTAEKAACDRKWMNYKAQTKAHGWKVYFTFMSRCMP